MKMMVKTMSNDVLFDFVIERKGFICPYCEKKLIFEDFSEEEAWQCRNSDCSAHGLYLFSIEKTTKQLRQYDTDIDAWLVVL